MLVDAYYTDARFKLQPGDEVLADKPGCASNYYFLAHTFIRLKILAMLQLSSGFCLIVTPLKGYDEPDILLSQVSDYVQ
ncbi:hypothetical protein MesoLjLa_49200 [Mesorhizobium sp. L-2-11]|nr:hypothetical protein MesoLjLa_49200 [Mesorhizobium sp. L-2-11]